MYAIQQVYLILGLEIFYREHVGPLIGLVICIVLMNIIGVGLDPGAVKLGL